MSRSDAVDTDAQRHGRAPTRTITSVGLLMRLYLGWRRENPDMVKGADYLLAAPPKLGTQREPERDQDGERHLVVGERLAAPGADEVDARGRDRIAR